MATDIFNIGLGNSMVLIRQQPITKVDFFNSSWSGDVI